MRTKPPKTQVSVLIPFKNEAKNLSTLLKSLHKQDYPSCLVEYLFVNDHSDDESENLLNEYRVLQSEGNGKKAALITGLARAKGELIITLDADCSLADNWLQTLVNYFENEQADFIICPVKIAPFSTLWEKLQAVEFQSLAASTGGAALGGMPIMCNGANLAFRTALAQAGDDIFKEKYTSGDDMFLLEHAKKSKAKIAYLKHRSAIASTSPVSWTKFWQQRTRWTSKSGGYTDAGIIFFGLIVLLANFSLLVLPFVSFSYFFLAFAMKVLVDFLILLVSSSFFKTSKVLWFYFLIVPFYPFYVLFSVVKGMLSRR